MRLAVDRRLLANVERRVHRQERAVLAGDEAGVERADHDLGEPRAGAVLSSTTREVGRGAAAGRSLGRGEHHPVVDRALQVVVDLVAAEVRRGDRDRVGPHRVHLPRRRRAARRAAASSGRANARMRWPACAALAEHLGDLRPACRACPCVALSTAAWATSPRKSARSGVRCERRRTRRAGSR